MSESNEEGTQKTYFNAEEITRYNKWMKNRVDLVSGYRTMVKFHQILSASLPDKRL
jgi:hypothetical protein